MRWRRVVPVIVIVGLIGLLSYGLTRNPTQLPSALIGDPVPEFELPTLAAQRPVLTDEALHGEVMLINTWASWCLACRAEHAQIAEFTMRTDVPVVGLNYKDTREAAKQWLNRFGNPFAVIVFDRQGQLGFDLGVGAVPESFLLDDKGIIRHKVVGPITQEILNNTLIPLVKKLRQEAA